MRDRKKKAPSLIKHVKILKGRIQIFLFVPWSQQDFNLISRGARVKKHSIKIAERHNCVLLKSLSMTHLWLSSQPEVCLPQVPMVERSAPQRRSCSLPEYYTRTRPPPPSCSSHNFSLLLLLVPRPPASLALLLPPGGTLWDGLPSWNRSYEPTFLFIITKQIKNLWYKKQAQ